MELGFAPLLSFIAVVAMIPLALWLLKRSSLGGRSAAGPLKLVSVLPLSAAQKLVVIEANSAGQTQWLVLGVTAQSIQTLHTMPAGVRAAAASDGPTSLSASLDSAPTPVKGFGEVLSRFRGKPPGAA
jgi:flagellar protein FliO/FliZ